MVRRRRHGRHGRSERGAAAVEFALIVPVLLVLTFGIISYGFMLTVRQSVSQAADEGARAAAVTVVDANRVSEGEKAIKDALSANGVDCVGGVLKKGTTVVGTCVVGPKTACSTGTGTTTGTTSGSSKCVTVTIVYNYRANPSVPTIGFGFALPETLTYSATARVS
jgi:Flp pilus assembly protein TadG